LHPNGLAVVDADDQPGGPFAGRRIEATVVNLHRARSPVFAAAMAAPFAERGMFSFTAKFDSFVNFTAA
jgi:hypothetical protein